MVSKILGATRNSYEWLVTLAGALYFLIGGLSLSFLSLIFKPFISRQQAQYLGRYGMHYLTWLFFAGLELTRLVKVDFSALDQLRNDESLVIAPNHPCLMDAIFVSSRLPNIVCVMKASVLNNPVLYGGAALGGFIRGDHPLQFIQQCKNALQQGDQLLLFPEGTRSRDNSVNAFKGGLALIAQQTGAIVQTVFIETDNLFLSKGWPILNKPDFPLIYKIKLGQRFQIEKQQDHRAFTRKLENYFKDGLKQNRLLAADAKVRPQQCPLENRLRAQ